MHLRILPIRNLQLSFIGRERNTVRRRKSACCTLTRNRNSVDYFSCRNISYIKTQKIACFDKCECLFAVDRKWPDTALQRTDSSYNLVLCFINHEKVVKKPGSHITICPVKPPNLV